jgi:hypothetical protein
VRGWSCTFAVWHCARRVAFDAFVSVGARACLTGAGSEASLRCLPASDAARDRAVGCHVANWNAGRFHKSQMRKNGPPPNTIFWFNFSIKSVELDG